MEPLSPSRRSARSTRSTTAGLVSLNQGAVENRTSLFGHVPPAPRPAPEPLIWKRPPEPPQPTGRLPRRRQNNEATGSASASAPVQQPVQQAPATAAGSASASSPAQQPAQQAPPPATG